MKRDLRITNLLRWYKTHGRNLPWRKTDDSYSIFVSEIMLQQTQASRVIDYYQAWLKTFPTWEALAKANTLDLLRAWAGLGYNRRALFLRDAAKCVIERGVPKTEDEWRTLKGVGPYTASAVYAFTSKQPSAAVDTNIRRVIGRSMLGIPFPAITDDSRIEKKLRMSLTKKSDWLVLHALMDLGSAICIPKTPICSKCPMKNNCLARNKILNAKRSPQKQINERIQAGKKYPDRIFRGKILQFIQHHKNTTIDEIGIAVDSSYQASIDREWMIRIIDRMIKDGLLEEKSNHFFIKQR